MIIDNSLFYIEGTNKLIERKTYIDNLKGFLMVLVVIGHFIVPLTSGSSNLLFIRLYIYTFHMPCFLIINGILFKGNEGYMNFKKSIKVYFIPYVIVNFILYSFMILFKVGGEYKLSSSYFNIGLPLWSFWYLIALFIYSIVTPYVVKYKFSIIVSIIISLLIGFFPTINYLSLTKIICFYPYYLIGNKLSMRVDVIRTKFSRVISIVFILIGTIIIYKFKGNLHLETYTFTVPYRDFLQNQSYAISFLLRLLQLIFGTIFSLSLICIFGNKHMAITRIGEKSIYPYILHNYILAIYYFINNHFNFLKYINSVTMYILFFLGCFIITYILSTNFVIKNTKFICEPIRKK
ncbi:acyltransferase family protein [Clostridium sp.]|uniref:acyltransferase family protein n=1 Tax=Clostridium sp. TaxID=1506 RepID=UPI0037C074DD